MPYGCNSLNVLLEEIFDPGYIDDVQVAVSDDVQVAMPMENPAYGGDSNGPPSAEYVGENRINRQLFGNEHTYGLFESTMPVVGTPRMVVFVIDFLDDDPDDFIFSVSDIERHFFDLSRIDEPVEFHLTDRYLNPGYYSMRDFFYRSSYGKLDITGDVIHYITQKPDSEYESWFDLMDEVLNVAGAADVLDWTQYDTSGTGHADGVFFVLRGFPVGRMAFGNMALPGPTQYVRNGINISSPGFMVDAGNNCLITTMVHEAVHMMGLLDIDTHAAPPLNPEGPGATTVMNAWATIGDLPGIMKYLFGWIEPIHIDTVGETRVTLKSISDYPQMAVVYPRGDKDNLNWFIIEYITPTNNNFGLDENASIHDFYIYPTVRPGGGLRIWRSSMNPEYVTNTDDY
jgi:M6 family metalloprotease-like protein